MACAAATTGVRAGASGVRETLAALAEALGRAAGASACTVARVEGAAAVDVARWAPRSASAGLARPHHAAAVRALRAALERRAPVAAAGHLRVPLAGPAGAFVALLDGVRRPREAARAGAAIAAEAAFDVGAATGRDDEEERAFAALRALGRLRPGMGAGSDLSAPAVAIGEALALREPELRVVRRAGLLHDLGKASLPAALLGQPRDLTVVERAVVERHPILAGRALAALDVPPAVVDAVALSHERWDGGGYPRGLAGERVPLAARIVAVCDAYAAMRRDRPHRAARGHREALDELARCAGSQFDPAVVAAARAVLGPDGPRPTVRLRLAG